MDEIQLSYDLLTNKMTFLSIAAQIKDLDWPHMAPRL